MEKPHVLAWNEHMKLLAILLTLWMSFYFPARMGYEGISVWIALLNAPFVALWIMFLQKRARKNTIEKGITYDPIVYYNGFIANTVIGAVVMLPIYYIARWAA